MDIWSRSKRSAVMGRIRSRDTKPELLLRSLLHRSGLRYSLRRRDLPGRPDIVLPKYRAVVFVHGCFWHRHKGCPVATTPKTRRAFWLAKFRANVLRDRRNGRALRRQGWKVSVVWECEVLRDPHAALRHLLDEMGVKPPARYADLPGRKLLLKVAEESLQWNLAQKGPASGGRGPGRGLVR
ncbi:MAG: DNA mismatch endonuclease Vsr [Lentisphaerae bacterium]|nr:DNA mismatch endonuclease Vsr [Lentisphaerota bacterium]